MKLIVGYQNQFNLIPYFGSRTHEWVWVACVIFQYMYITCHGKYRAWIRNQSSKSVPVCCIFQFACWLVCPLCLLVFHFIYALYSFVLYIIFIASTLILTQMLPKKIFRIHFTRFKAATLSKCTDKNKTPLNGVRFVQHQTSLNIFHTSDTNFYAIDIGYVNL